MASWRVSQQPWADRLVAWRARPLELRHRRRIHQGQAQRQIARVPWVVCFFFLLATAGSTRALAGLMAHQPTAPVMCAWQAMCFAWRTDNSGPPVNVDEVLSDFAIAQTQFPGAKIVAGTCVEECGKVKRGGWGAGWSFIARIALLTRICSLRPCGAHRPTPPLFLPPPLCDQPRLTTLRGS